MTDWGTRVARSPDGRLAFVPRPGWIGPVIDDAAAWGDREFLVQGGRRLTFAEVVAEVRSRAVAAEPDGDLLAVPTGPGWVVAFLATLYAGRPAVLARLDERVEVATMTTSPPGSRREVLETDPAIVMATSGTTARPRAVVLSQRAVIANLHNLLARTQQLPPHDPSRPAAVSLATFPLVHMSGVQTVLQYLVAGGRLVFPEGRFDPAEVLGLIEREQVTAWAAVPTMVTMVLDHPSVDAHDLSSVRSLAIGGAPVPTSLFDRAAKAFPNAARRMAHSYGSTEAGGTVGTGLHRSGTELVVQPLSTVEVRIEAAGPDGVGEILVRAPTVMDGYLGVDPAEQPIDANGWLHTGDLGRLHPDGALEITGRAKDLIIRGGENISPAAVEAALLEHPDVAEVAAFGVPSGLWGEEVAVVIRVRAGARADRSGVEQLARKRLPGFAVPTHWHWREGALPLTASGKVDKRRLRTELAATAPEGAQQ